MWGLEHLQGVSQLERLDLSNTGVTDEGLKHLKGLPHLQTLVLRGTKVTKDGVRALRDSHAGIRLAPP
jgi:Leucine-rich repeat (LRR) protein